MRYLVTGATGFIGRHVVERLIAQGDEVTVLVRPTSTTRWKDLCAQQPELASATVIKGDLGDLAPSASALKGVSGGELIHLAAIYDLDATPEALRTANVQGTEVMLDLARAMKARCVHHVSSIAVSGSYRGVFTEDMFDEGQKFPHPYMETKFQSEKLVRESGMTWRIYRPSLVIGDSKTGEADRVDGPYFAFPVIRRMRDALPVWAPLPGPEGGDLNLVPVDFVAEAIAAISRKKGEDGKTFHIVDPEPSSLGDTLNIFCRAAHAPEFTIRFDRRIGGLVPKPLTAMVGAIPAVQHLWNQILSSLELPAAAVALMDSPARFPCDNTTVALKGTSISCPPLSRYAEHIWDYWLRHMDTRRISGKTIRGAISGKKILITGASSGIGRSVALDAARHGATIIGVARSKDGLDEVGAEVTALGGHFFSRPCDLSNTEACDALLNDVWEEFHGIDILINNAGRSIRRSIVQSTDRLHDFERTMRINYFGAIALILAALPKMEKQGSGQIINVSSIGVQTLPPRFAAYVASKSALDAFTRIAQSETAGSGVTLTTVHMPLVRTPMIAPTSIYRSFPTMAPEEAAGLIIASMVTKPRHVSTRLGKFGEIMNAVAPGVSQLIMGTAFRLLPDSTPQGEGDDAQGDGRTASTPPAVAILGQMMRGIHL